MRAVLRGRPFLWGSPAQLALASAAGRDRAISSRRFHTPAAPIGLWSCTSGSSFWFRCPVSPTCSIFLPKVACWSIAVPPTHRTDEYLLRRQLRIRPTPRPGSSNQSERQSKRQHEAFWLNLSFSLAFQEPRDVSGTLKLPPRRRAIHGDSSINVLGSTNGQLRPQTVTADGRTAPAKAMRERFIRNRLEVHAGARSALGLRPVQRLKAREKAAGSEKPRR